MGARVVAWLLVVGLPAGCSSGACEGDGVGPDSYIPQVERWVRVLPPMPAVPGGEGTLSVTWTVVPIGEDREEGPSRRDTIPTHADFTEDIEEGLSEGRSAFLALQSEGLVSEMVAFGIEHDPETGYHLLGGGCFDDDELGLRTSLGDDYDEVIGSLIGMTDETRIRSLLTRPLPGAGTSTLSGSEDP